MALLLWLSRSEVPSSWK